MLAVTSRSGIWRCIAERNLAPLQCIGMTTSGDSPSSSTYRVIDIILRRRAEMKSAEDRVQFADPRHRHGSLYRVDQPDMAARRDHDEPASLDDVAGCVFVRMLVGDEAA